jgi:hypothetical protein
MPRRPRDRLPTPHEIAAAPQLAALASLTATIDVTIVALVAAHDELQRRDDGRDAVCTPAGAAADNLIAQAQALAVAILDYRLLLHRDVAPLPRSAQ